MCVSEENCDAVITLHMLNAIMIKIFSSLNLHFFRKTYLESENKSTLSTSNQTLLWLSAGFYHLQKYSGYLKKWLSGYLRLVGSMKARVSEIIESQGDFILH